MPWNNIWDPGEGTIAAMERENQHYMVAQQRAMRQAMADAARRETQEQLHYERRRSDPEYQHYLYPPPRRTRNEADIVAIINEFSTAFNHGIRELVVSDQVYQQLIDYFNNQVRIRNEPADKYRGKQFLTINTAGGPMKIMSESHKESFRKIDFDAYLEDVE